MTLTDSEKLERIKRVFPNEEEAQSILEYDKATDKMTMKQLNDEMSDSQRKVVKKMKNAQRQPTAYKFKQPTSRKPNETKIAIMQKIADMVGGFAEKSELTNVSRTLSFEYQGKSFEINLTEHRVKK